MKQNLTSRKKVIQYFIIVAIMCMSSVAFAVDLVSECANQSFYGRQIGEDIRVGFSFNGKPTININQRFNFLDGNTPCTSASAPLQANEELVGSTKNNLFQSVRIVGAHFKETQLWADLGRKGYSEEDAGVLTVSIYSQLANGQFDQIFTWTALKACPVEYDEESSIITFLCTGEISWSAPCNTLTKDPNRHNLVGSWNNTISSKTEKIGSAYTDRVDWTTKCNTLTTDTSNQKWAKGWNNAIVGKSLE